MAISEELYNFMHKHDGKIQLQGIGWREAKKASDFKIGDIMLCNFGSTQEIVDVKPCGKTMIHLFVKCDNGKIYDKRCKLETLYAYKV